MISEKTLQETSLKVTNLLGLDFSASRRVDLERGIFAAAHDLGINETIPEIEEWLSKNNFTPHEIKILTQKLTVGETYFFREKASLEVFQKKIIPIILQERRGKEQYLRIWSAGCCSGEEPYTLAILLSEMIPDLENWNITILATDINHQFLKKAQTGIFSQWSFRETPQNIKQRYFTPNGNDWEIIPEIKNMVTFSLLNLAEDQYPSAQTNTFGIDVIFCRNVLMYFSPDHIKMAVQRFFHSLIDKGWLITSAVELNDDYFSPFANVPIEKGVFYRKVPKTKPHINHAASGSLNEKRIKLNKHADLTKTKKKSSPVHRNPLVFNESPSIGKEISDLFDKGLYQQCADKCLTTINKEVSDPNILIFLIKSLANIGKLTEAREFGEKLLAQNRMTADSFYLLATILIEENEMEMAESMLKRALYLDPHHLLSHFQMIKSVL